MAKHDLQLETGVFYSRHDAEMAVRMLHDLDYTDDEIGVMTSESPRKGVIVIAVRPHPEDRRRLCEVLGSPMQSGRVTTELGEIDATELGADMAEERIPPRRTLP